jgi:hypothetical protein
LQSNNLQFIAHLILSVVSRADGYYMTGEPGKNILHDCRCKILTGRVGNVK